MAKSSSDTKMGTGAKNTKNFVFALLSPDKSRGGDNTELNVAANASNEMINGDGGGGPGTKTNERARSCRGKNHVISNNAKKIKIDRSIDENSQDTIFGHM